MSSTAKFKISRDGGASWSPFSSNGFDCYHGDALIFRLEDLPALDVQRILLEVVTKSKVIAAIAFSAGGAPLPPTTDITTTMPLTNVGSYLIRCTVYGSFDPTGRQITDVRERVVSIRGTTHGLRKIAPAEQTQYNATEGWVDALDELIDVLENSEDWKASRRTVTSVALPAYTRVGNVITAVGAVALPVVNGVALNDNDTFILAHGAAGADNGWYDVTDKGSVGVRPYIITRSGDADVSAKVTSQCRTSIEEGGAAGHVFVLTTTGVIVLNTTPLTFVDAGALTLVTSVLTGTVNAFGVGGSYEHLESDNATAGGVWRSGLRMGVLGACSTAGGDIDADGNWDLWGLHDGANISLLSWAGPDLDVGMNNVKFGSIHLHVGTHAGAEFVASYGASTVIYFNNAALQFNNAAIDFTAAGAITATGNPTWNTGTGAFTIGGAVTLTNNQLQFVQGATPTLDQTTAANDTAGAAFAHRAQKGGLAVGAVGKLGGANRQYGGEGSDGTAALAAGGGGSGALYGGKGGVDNGGGGGAGGGAYIDAGAATGAAANGQIYIGSASTANTKTAAINIGNTTDLPIIHLKSPESGEHALLEAHTNVDATPYAVLPADRELAVKTDVARTVNLEALATAGDCRVLIVSDRDPVLGGAAANPITIHPAGGEKINGVAADIVIDWNGGVLWLKADVSAATWRIIGKVS